MAHEVIVATLTTRYFGFPVTFITLSIIIIYYIFLSFKDCQLPYCQRILRYLLLLTRW